MNCSRARNLVQARRDGELQPRQRRELQAHLDACPACARLSRAEAATQRWLEELPVAAPPANFEWRLKLRLAALDRPLPVPAAGRQPAAWLWPFVATTAAAAVLVLAAGLYWNGRRGPEAPVVTEANQPTALRPWAPNPADAVGRLGWPRLVPVRAGAPLGPEVPGNVTASILGQAGADSVAPRSKLRTEPIDAQPVRFSR